MNVCFFFLNDIVSSRELSKSDNTRHLGVIFGVDFKKKDTLINFGKVFCHSIVSVALFCFSLTEKEE